MKTRNELLYLHFCEYFLCKAFEIEGADMDDGKGICKSTYLWQTEPHRWPLYIIGSFLAFFFFLLVFPLIDVHLQHQILPKNILWIWSQHCLLKTFNWSQLYL